MNDHDLHDLLSMNKRNHSQLRKSALTLGGIAGIFGIVSTLISLGVLGVVAYVAYHFITKFW